MTGSDDPCSWDDSHSPDPHALPWGQGGKNAGVAPTGKDLCIWLRSQKPDQGVARRYFKYLTCGPLVRDSGWSISLDHSEVFGRRVGGDQGTHPAAPGAEGPGTGLAEAQQALSSSVSRGPTPPPLRFSDFGHLPATVTTRWTFIPPFHYYLTL